MSVTLNCSMGNTGCHVHFIGQCRDLLVIKTTKKPLIQFAQQALQQAACTTVAVTGEDEAGCAEQTFAVDGNEVRQASGRGFVRMAGKGAAVLRVVVSNGVIPVNVGGKDHMVHLLGNGGSDGVQVLQVTAVGNRQHIAAAAAGLQILEHGVHAGQNAGLNFHTDIVAGEVHICLDGDILTGQNLELTFVHQLGDVLQTGGLGTVVGKAAHIEQGVNGVFHHNGLAVHCQGTAVSVACGLHHQRYDAGIAGFALFRYCRHTLFAGQGQFNLQRLGKLIERAVERVGHRHQNTDNALFAVDELDSCLGLFQLNLGTVQTGAVIVAHHQLLPVGCFTGQGAAVIQIHQLHIRFVAVENRIDIAGDGVIFNNNLLAADGAVHTAGREDHFKSCLTRGSIQIFRLILLREAAVDHAAAHILQRLQAAVGTDFSQILLSSHENALGIVLTLLEPQCFADSNDGGDGNCADNRNDADHYQQFRQGITQGTFF